LNQPVKLPVHIQTGPSGAYSGIVDLIDPSIGLVAHSVMCTVIASEQLNKENHYTASVDREAPRPGASWVYVNVPKGTTALRVQLKQHGDNVTLGARASNGQGVPTGIFTTTDSFPSTWFIPASRRSAFDQTFTNPAPGVWRFWVSNDNGYWPTPYDPTLLAHPAPPTAFNMTITAFGTESAIDSTVSSTTANGDHSATVTFKDSLAPINKAKIEAIGVGSERIDKTKVSAGLEQKLYDLEVAPGTTKLETDIESLSPGAKANLSLIVFYVNEKGGFPVDTAVFDMDPGSKKHLEIKNPAPGKYRIAVDAWGDVPADGVEVRYRDIVLNPLYGNVTVNNDQPQDMAPQATRTVAIDWKLNAIPNNGRQPIVEVGLFSDAIVTMTYDASKFFALADAASKAGKPRPEPIFTNEKVPLATQTIVLRPD
jgi:hypothetical protein